MQPNNKTKALSFGKRANPPKQNLQLPWLHSEGKASKQKSKNLFSIIAFLEGKSQTKPSSTSPWYETIPEQEKHIKKHQSFNPKKTRALVWPHPNPFKEKKHIRPKNQQKQPCSCQLTFAACMGWGLTGEDICFFHDRLEAQKSNQWLADTNFGRFLFRVLKYINQLCRDP